MIAVTRLGVMPTSETRFRNPFSAPCYHWQGVLRDQPSIHTLGEVLGAAGVMLPAEQGERVMQFHIQ
jgi:hypothetical protein